MVKIEINYQKILKAAKSLSLKDRAKLARALQKDTLQEQWRQIRAEITSQPKAKISVKDIKQAVDDVREEIYAQSHRRH